MTNPTFCRLVLACGLLVPACSSQPDAQSADETKDGTSDATTSDTAAADMTGPDGAGDPKPNADTTDTKASTPPAANEKAKDPNALVLNLSYSMKGGGKVDDKTSAELQKAALERIANSSKLASPTSKVDKPRTVNVTVMIDEPTDGKKGLTVKMGLVGVEPEGKCPLFDIDQNFTLSDAKKTNADDVIALRRSAITALLDKLEAEAGTLKPQANCTPFKKK